MVGVIRIAKNSVLVLIARMTDVISSLILAGILSRYLGVRDYGNYLFIMGLVLTITSFAHLGLPQILVREMSQNRDSMAKLVRAGLMLTSIFLCVTGLIILSIVIISGLSSAFFLSILVAFVSEAIVLFSGPFVSAFISFEKMQYDAAVTIVNRLLVIGLMICVSFFDLGFISVFVSAATANFCRLMMILYISRKTNIEYIHGVEKNDLVYLFKQTLPVGLSFIVTQLYLYTNLFILKMLRGPEDVALFQAPFSIILKLQILPAILIVAFGPVMARLAVSETSYSYLKTVYTYIIKNLFIFCLPLTWFCFFMAKDITTFIFGDQFLNAGISFQIIIWIIGFQFLNIFSDMVLQVIFKQQRLILSSCVVFISNAVLSFLLISEYGYVGGSIAILISAGILFGLNFYFVSRYLKGVSLSFMIKPICSFLLVLFICSKITWLSQPFLVVLGFLLYTVVLFALRVFSRSEFRLFVKTINERGYQLAA